MPAGRRDAAKATAVSTGRSPRRRASAGVQQALPVQLRTLGQPGRAKHVPVTASCGGCDHRWTDEDAAHCRGCHAHFDTVAGFDGHLAGCPTYVPIEPPTRSRRKAS